MVESTNEFNYWPDHETSSRGLDNGSYRSDEVGTPDIGGPRLFDGDLHSPDLVVPDVLDNIEYPKERGAGTYEPDIADAKGFWIQF